MLVAHRQSKTRQGKARLGKVRQGKEPWRCLAATRWCVALCRSPSFPRVRARACARATEADDDRPTSPAPLSPRNSPHRRRRANSEPGLTLQIPARPVRRSGAGRHNLPRPCCRSFALLGMLRGRERVHTGNSWASPSVSPIQREGHSRNRRVSYPALTAWWASGLVDLRHVGHWACGMPFRHPGSQGTSYETFLSILHFGSFCVYSHLACSNEQFVGAASPPLLHERERERDHVVMHAVDDDI